MLQLARFIADIARVTRTKLIREIRASVISFYAGNRVYFDPRRLNREHRRDMNR